jgi:energy-coupling factor transporter ATP-binding protein EcfA2
MNKPQFDRLTEILGYFEKYTNDIQKVSEPISQYIEITNSYLRDSNKALEFDETGYLCVNIKDYEKQPITSLSSGESQIVVIITHLAFNPAAQRANVFIVDEPELSLHLRWQELFVDSVRAVNPDLQVILATHSPSIILDKVEYCKDLRPTIS